MLDDFNRENVIAVSFSEDADAYQALSRLKELDAKGDASVRGAAVVMRDEDGKIVTKDQFGKASREPRPAGSWVC